MNLSMNNELSMSNIAVEYSNWGLWFSTQLELLVRNPENPVAAAELMTALAQRGPTPDEVKTEIKNYLRRMVHKSAIPLTISLLCQIHNKLRYAHRIAGMSIPAWVIAEYEESDSFLESLK